MSEKLKDIDYLFISARVKSLENDLLTHDKMEQILEVKTDEEAIKIITESGYPSFSPHHPEEMDRALDTMRQNTLDDLETCAPDVRYLDVFKLKYDYHNVKAILKASVLNVPDDRMLMDMGRVPVEELKTAITNGDYSSLPHCLSNAIEEAKEVLGTTRDPQRSDIVLDRWMYWDMTEVAEATDSAFLGGYVDVIVDAANLRTLVRTMRMGKNVDFLKGVLFEGGTIGIDAVLSVANASGSGLAELYASTQLETAAEQGADALSGGPLTDFEKACDDAVGEYLAGAQYVAFGEAPLVGFLAAKETEYMNLRILLMGRLAGLSPEVIRSRLRKSYV